MLLYRPHEKKRLKKRMKLFPTWFVLFENPFTPPTCLIPRPRKLKFGSDHVDCHSACTLVSLSIRLLRNQGAVILLNPSRLMCHHYLLCDHESSGTVKYCSQLCCPGKQATARLLLGIDSERIDPNGSSGNSVLPLYSALLALQKNTTTKQLGGSRAPIVLVRRRDGRKTYRRRIPGKK